MPDKQTEDLNKLFPKKSHTQTKNKEGLLPAIARELAIGAGSGIVQGKQNAIDFFKDPKGETVKRLGNLAKTLARNPVENPEDFMDVVSPIGTVSKLGGKILPKSVRIIANQPEKFKIGVGDIISFLKQRGVSRNEIAALGIWNFTKEFGMAGRKSVGKEELMKKLLRERPSLTETIITEKSPDTALVLPGFREYNNIAGGKNYREIIYNSSRYYTDVPWAHKYGIDVLDQDRVGMTRVADYEDVDGYLGPLAYEFQSDMHQAFGGDKSSYDLIAYPHKNWVQFLMQNHIRHAIESRADRAYWASAEHQFVTWGSPQFVWEKTPEGTRIFFKEQAFGRRELEIATKEINRAIDNLVSRNQSGIPGVRYVNSPEEFMSKFDDVFEEFGLNPSKVWNRIQNSPEEGMFRPRMEFFQDIYNRRAVKAARKFGPVGQTRVYTTEGSGFNIYHGDGSFATTVHSQFEAEAEANMIGGRWRPVSKVEHIPVYYVDITEDLANKFHKEGFEETYAAMPVALPGEETNDITDDPVALIDPRINLK